MPRLRRLAVVPLALLLALPLGGCASVGWGGWNGGDRVSFGGRADPADGLQTNVVTHHVAAAPGGRVRITNLAGDVELRQGDGDQVVLEARVHALGADDADTADLLAAMQWVKTTDADGRPAWGLAYPARHATLHYVTDGRAFEMTSKRHGRRITITTEKRPGSPTLFADLTVTYPADTALEVDTLVGNVTGGALRGSLDAEIVVGTIAIESFDGDLALDAGSGDIDVREAVGAARLDTGSGDIRVRALRAVARLDTGSGDIHVGALENDADLDTGSGDIVVGTAHAARVRADTGSGDITIGGGAVNQLHLDTGSGRIEIDGVEFVKLHGDTGSGSVVIRSSLERAEHVHLDTGSGDVTLITGPGASFDARTSLASGRVHVGFDDATIERNGWRATRVHRGDGRTRIHVDTGSGHCTIKPGS